MLATKVFRSLLTAAFSSTPTRTIRKRVSPFGNALEQLEDRVTPTTLMPLPSQSGTFSSNVRGFWFTAPTDFAITGLRVPTDASSGDQSISVVRLDAAPPVYSGTTDAFTTLYLTQNNTDSGILTVNIPVYTGDVIGILGQRATTTSYGSGDFTSDIFGQSVILRRLGMQFPLTSTAPQQLWTETGGSTGRIEMYYDSLPAEVKISAPSVVSANTGETVSYTVTFAGADPDTINFTAKSLILNKTGTAKGTVQVSGTGNTRTVTITKLSGDGSLGISIKAGTAKDTNGDPLPAAGPSETFVVNNTAPKVTIGKPIITARKLIFTTAVDYIVTISDSNLSSANLTAGDITLNSTKGNMKATIVVTQIDATHYRVSLSNFSAQDSIWITLPPSIAQDSLGVLSAGPINSAKINVYSFGPVPT